MALEDVSAEREKHESGSLAYKVLTCFLCQPSQVGPHAECLRSIDFTRAGDRRMFSSAVAEDFEVIYGNSASNEAKQDALAIYQHGWALMGWR